ncbi:Hydrolase, haloacid dehalogenase-like family [Bacillus cereus]|uniref:Cof-type HAD-IIB family hydrolase n=1 Tax=Bacillus wiedmannii TaxID=1890302 RepID=UPI00065BFC0F|nr:Cof-type HAD-IIB family hydrolase [Bacillus wiedmannii]KMP77032.1 HAD family hydrolase [Bacillus cereus]MBG9855436.1 HAD family hydrolase [Bacillus wiedmannii]MCQ6547120.1 Cof-type HAD-IIB family hydrolase [Bacillus wiedmannii]MCQ6575303.1 Cof-type HAD-IIB family hydrolase [Bacillus wiedmannii]MCU5578086.1 Cof-type HAD-IIB family hydrolase [Bacillus wiedmannii]
MKLIALDMDGTLLSSNLEISKENLQAIQTAKEAGHIVMICSGRAKEDALKLLEEYKLSLPVGASNGAIVYVDGKVINSRCLQNDKVYKLAKLLEFEGFPYKLYTNKGVYSPYTWQDQVMQAFEENKHALDVTLEELERITEKQKKSNLITDFQKIEDVVNNPELEISKFFILTFNATHRAQLLSMLQEDTDISVTASAPTNVEIMDKHGHKGNGLQEMAAYFNIPIEDTIAIGDNFNDVPMLQVAGLSVAMGNAEEDVKKLCDVVTLTNNEHGVAHAIEKFVLKQTSSSK